MSGFYPILVGSRFENNKDYILDSNLDNISNKNKNYCELTGMYWIWKNVKSDIKGLVHYRRYLKKHFLSTKIIGEDSIKTIMQNYDIILPVPRVYPFSSVEIHYKNSHNFSDLMQLRFVVSELSPDYLEDFDNFFEGSHLSLFNIIIAKAEIYDQYCSWLFPILFKLESKLNLTAYDSYQTRVIGFLGERLLNVWIRHNKIQYRIKYLPVFHAENFSYTKKLINYIKKTYL